MLKAACLRQAVFNFAGELLVVTDESGGRSSLMKQHGFTLIELMIVVAIIGILAAIAIPGFSRYMREAKNSEATGMLRSVADGATVYYNAEHVFDAAGFDIRKDFFPGCEETGDPTACSDVKVWDGTQEIGQRISPEDPGLKLNESPWTKLNFSINKPFLYVIGYTSDPTPGTSTFTATATGSLETSEDSIFSIAGNANGGGANMSVGNVLTIKDGN